MSNEAHDANKMRIATDAYWRALADVDFEAQPTLDLRVYSDSHYPATVAHPLILAPR